MAEAKTKRGAAARATETKKSEKTGEAKKTGATKKTGETKKTGAARRPRSKAAGAAKASKATTGGAARASKAKASKATTGGAAKASKAKASGAARASKAKASAGADAAPPRPAEEAARKYFDGIAARDPDAAVAGWRSDCVDDIVPLGVFRGPDAVRVIFSEMFAAMPDVEMTVERIVAEANVAAVQWRLSGHFTGAPFQGIEPTGRLVELRGTDVVEVDEEGRIARNTGYYDGAAFARAIGMLPPQESGPERAMLAGFNAVTKLRRTIRSR